jgi:hypothetical protein
MERLSRSHGTAKARRDEAKHEYWRLQDRLQSITHKIENSIGSKTPPRPVASQSQRVGTPATKQNKHPDSHYVETFPGTNVRGRQHLLSDGIQTSIDGIAAAMEQMELAVHNVDDEAKLFTSPEKPGPEAATGASRPRRRSSSFDRSTQQLSPARRQSPNRVGGGEQASGLRRSPSRNRSQSPHIAFGRRSPPPRFLTRQHQPAASTAAANTPVGASTPVRPEGGQAYDAGTVRAKLAQFSQAFRLKVPFHEDPSKNLKFEGGNALVPHSYGEFQNVYVKLVNNKLLVDFGGATVGVDEFVMLHEDAAFRKRRHN